MVSGKTKATVKVPPAVAVWTTGEVIAVDSDATACCTTGDVIAIDADDWLSPVM